MEDFETHPRGTGEVLLQLRAGREALEVQVEDQRKAFKTFLKEMDALHYEQHNHFKWALNEWVRRTESTQS